jgi:hypothetical protein
VPQLGEDVLEALNLGLGFADLRIGTGLGGGYQPGPRARRLAASGVRSRATWRHRRADRLGLAVQLCTLPWLGFVPDEVSSAPAGGTAR